MPQRDRLMFKYKGDGSEFHEGIPARDIMESERDTLTDEQLVTLAASKLYSPRNDAPEEAAKAERRIEKEAVSQAPADAVVVVVDVPKASAPKASEKK